MSKVPDDDGGGILMPILASLLVVVGIGTAGLFGLIGYIGHSTQNQYESSSTGDTSQVRSQTPAQPVQNQVENWRDSSQPDAGNTETNIDMDSIEKSISDKVPQEYKSSEWFLVNCDTATGESVFVDMQIDQGNDDMDAALSLSADYYEIAKNQIENADTQFESFSMTVVNKGAPVGLFSTVDGEIFTVISNGKKSEIAISDHQAESDPKQGQTSNGGAGTASSGTTQGQSQTATPNHSTAKPQTGGTTDRGSGNWGEDSTTKEITGSLSRTAYWVNGGKSYHFTKDCPSLSRSTNIKSGTLQDALNAGKTDPCNNCAGG